MSPDVVVQHGHCLICGKAKPFDQDETWCSDPCKAKLDAQNKKRRQMMLFLYGAMGLTLLLLFWGQLSGSRV